MTRMPTWLKCQMGMYINRLKHQSGRLEVPGSSPGVSNHLWSDWPHSDPRNVTHVNLILSMMHTLQVHQVASTFILWLHPGHWGQTLGLGGYCCTKSAGAKNLADQVNDVGAVSIYNHIVVILGCIDVWIHYITEQSLYVNVQQTTQCPMSQTGESPAAGKA